LLGLIPYFERWRERDLLEYSEAEKNDRFLLGRALLSDVTVLNKDAAVAFVTSD
jgi:hypothetical protein